MTRGVRDTLDEATQSSPHLLCTRKSLSVSDNYRANALSSHYNLCKVLDTVSLRKCGDMLSTCDLQTGLKNMVRLMYIYGQGNHLYYYSP